MKRYKSRVYIKYFKLQTKKKYVDSDLKEQNLLEM